MSYVNFVITWIFFFWFSASKSQVQMYDVATSLVVGPFLSAFQNCPPSSNPAPTVLVYLLSSFHPFSFEWTWLKNCQAKLQRQLIISAPNLTGWTLDYMEQTSSDFWTEMETAQTGWCLSDSAALIVPGHKWKQSFEVELLKNKAEEQEEHHYQPKTAFVSGGAGKRAFSLWMLKLFY